MGIKELPRVVRFIPEIILAITVTACDEVYRKIACWLNDMGESPLLLKEKNDSFLLLAYMKIAVIINRLYPIAVLIISIQKNVHRDTFSGCTT